MGYYTKYSMEVRHPGDYRLLEDEHLLRFIIDELRTHSEEAHYALDTSGKTCDECKWYEHEETLKEFSKGYPGLLLVLDGEGEGRGDGQPDLWRKYFLHGKCQVEKATWSPAPFDRDKLL